MQDAFTPFVAAHRGWLWRRKSGFFNSDSWSKRYYVLEGDKLFSYRGLGEVEHENVIDLMTNYVSVHPTNERYRDSGESEEGCELWMFQLTYGRSQDATRTLFFGAPSESGMWEWVHELVKVVNQRKRSQPVRSQSVVVGSGSSFAAYTSLQSLSKDRVTIHTSGRYTTTAASSYAAPFELPSNNGSDKESLTLQAPSDIRTILPDDFDQLPPTQQSELIDVYVDALRRYKVSLVSQARSSAISTGGSKAAHAVPTRLLSSSLSSLPPSTPLTGHFLSSTPISSDYSSFSPPKQEQRVSGDAPTSGDAAVSNGKDAVRAGTECTRTPSGRTALESEAATYFGVSSASTPVVRPQTLPACLPTYSTTQQRDPQALLHQVHELEQDLVTKDHMLAKMHAEQEHLKEKYFFAIAMSLKLQNQLLGGSSANMPVQEMYERVCEEGVPVRKWSKWLARECQHEPLAGSPVVLSSST